MSRCFRYGVPMNLWIKMVFVGGAATALVVLAIAFASAQSRRSG